MQAMKIKSALATEHTNGTRVVTANRVSLVTESFGDPRDPVALLIQGASASMMRWPEEFCRRIAHSGRFVIRYDNRDTGQSTSFPAGKPGYHVGDLAKDAVGVLDAYGIAKAHVAGFSMGGMIVQHLAIFHGERVLSATIGGSTPDPSGIGKAATGLSGDRAELPGPAPITMQLIKFLATVDWNDKKAVIDAWVREDLDLTGSGDVRNEAETRRIITDVVARARDIRSNRLNHPIAVATTPYWRDRLKHVAVQTLVFHGSEDAALPPEHGRAIAAEVPGAKFTLVAGMGHVIAPNSKYWDTFADAIIANSGG